MSSHGLRTDSGGRLIARRPADETQFLFLSKKQWVLQENQSKKGYHFPLEQMSRRVKQDNLRGDEIKKYR